MCKVRDVYGGGVAMSTNGVKKPLLSSTSSLSWVMVVLWSVVQAAGGRLGVHPADGHNMIYASDSAQLPVVQTLRLIVECDEVRIGVPVGLQRLAVHIGA